MKLVEFIWRQPKKQIQNCLFLRKLVTKYLRVKKRTQLLRQ